jgi:hypothetical protein
LKRAGLAHKPLSLPSNNLPLLAANTPTVLSLKVTLLLVV